MSKLKDLLMMAVEKEQFKIGDKTFQIIEVVEAEQPQPDDVKKILVPKEVKIYTSSNLLSVGFGDNQLLFVGYNQKSYSVAPITVAENIQCELIKCERAELKKGDLAFRTEEDEEFDLLSHYYYSVIINDSKHCYVADNKNICVSEVNWKHWYKLQPIV